MIAWAPVRRSSTDAQAPSKIHLACVGARARFIKERDPSKEGSGLGDLDQDCKIPSSYAHLRPEWARRREP